MGNKLIPALFSSFFAPRIDCRGRESAIYAQGHHSQGNFSGKELLQELGGCKPKIMSKMLRLGFRL